MRDKEYAARRLPPVLACVLTMVFLLCAVAPAYSWQNVRDIMIVFKRQLRIAYDVDGACVRAKGYSADIPGTWPWPLMQIPNPNSPGNLWPLSAWSWGSTPASWSTMNMPPVSTFTAGQRTQVTFGGTGNYITGPILSPPNTPFYFFLRYHFHQPLGGFTPANKQVSIDFSWISSALGPYPASHVPSGLHYQVFTFIINSPPVFFNPTETPEGAPNATNMVIRNLQFAVSPSAIGGGEEFSLDNPTVAGLFSASQDPLRSGPFTIAPGSSYQPVLDASIVDPQPGGSTVICKGTVEDEFGDPQEFLLQFIAGSDPAPVGYNPTWIIATLIALVLAGGFILRRRLARH